MSQSAFFTPNTKLGVISSVNFRTSVLLNFFGISLSYDETATVREVCMKFDVNQALFLFVCNIYYSENYRLNPLDIVCFPVDAAIDYIRKAHDYFMSEIIPSVKQEYYELEPTLNSRDENQTTILFDCFMNMIQEHVLCMEHVFVQYKEGGEINQMQSCMLYNQEDQINTYLSRIVDQLSSIKMPDGGDDKLIHFKNYLSFLESDFITHNKIKNETLIAMLNQTSFSY